MYTPHAALSGKQIALIKFIFGTLCVYRGGEGNVAFIGVAQPTPDSSAILVLNKFNPTDEDSFVCDRQRGLFPCFNREAGRRD